MSEQSGARRAWITLAVVPMSALVVSCGPMGKQIESYRGTPALLPTASAPPDPGAAPPPIKLHDPNSGPRSAEDRPQEQLAQWSEPLADELNVPRTALQAYGYAARSLEVTQPRCGISWTVLAGIGAVESSHGRYGGARLDATGRPDVPIRGLPLNGDDGVAHVRDTDGGRFDGDPVFDRAIGPLQFIPATWEKWAVDADGDGVADPNDLDDAALAAGRYLCDVGGDMRDPDGFWRALFDYNQSRAYGQDVLDHADHYGRKSRTAAAG